MVAAPKVYIVDDDPAVLRSLEHLLKSAGYAPAGFGSPIQFLENYQPTPGSCLLLDMAMPGKNGLAVQKILHGIDAKLPIIFLTGRGSIPISVEAMKRGAVDFLMKPVQDTILLETIAEALAKDCSEHTEDYPRQQTWARIRSLTKREREVLDCVVRGMLNREIARSLKISERTVKFHRAHLMQKFGVPHLAGLIRMVEQTENGSRWAA